MEALPAHTAAARVLLWHLQDWLPPSWLNFFPPILEHFCHFSYKFTKWVSFCPDGDHGVSFNPEYHTHPLIFTQLSHESFRDVYTGKHKTLPIPSQNSAFPGLNLKLGKMNYCLCKMRSIVVICAKSGQNFSRSGHKKNIHTSFFVLHCGWGCSHHSESCSTSSLHAAQLRFNLRFKLYYWLGSCR